ncbi:MAG: GNAT family N-acetyltransferase [Acidimicrobiales bacterium]
MENEQLELVRFDDERDMESVLRVWTETGWFDGEDRQKAQIKEFFQANDGRSLVALLDGDAESVVHCTLGSMRYGTVPVCRELSVGAITAVTTSRIARKLGAASRLTARTIAEMGDDGAAIALLGMFEQGFYDRFGFGVGPYEIKVFAYPGSLRVPAEYRTPERFDFEHHSDELHDSVVNRYRTHGGVVIGGERSTTTAVNLDYEVSIYGYRTDGAISHWMALEHSGETGPDRVVAWAYQSPEQCLELLRVIQEWGDQVDLIRFIEPPWMQAQDFDSEPGHNYRRTKGTKVHVRTEADAWWQIRIVDIETCIAAMAPVSEPFEVVVEIDDPVEHHLTGSGYSGSWKPLTGMWRFSFGESHSAERVTDAPNLDLRTSINALSRWWLGVLPATALGVTGQMDADHSTLARLDRLTAHLPRPHPGWDF